jgi:hypothetical protein
MKKILASYRTKKPVSQNMNIEDVFKKLILTSYRSLKIEMKICGWSMHQNKITYK